MKLFHKDIGQTLLTDDDIDSMPLCRSNSVFRELVVHLLKFSCCRCFVISLLLFRCYELVCDFAALYGPLQALRTAVPSQMRALNKYSTDTVVHYIVVTHCPPTTICSVPVLQSTGLIFTARCYAERSVVTASCL